MHTRHRSRSLQALAPLLVLASLSPAAADVHGVPNANGPLKGKTVVFSPGHGIMWDAGLNRWRFQRGVTHGVQEDIHTNEIFIEVVQRYLANAGARVESCRERSYQINEVILDDGASGYSETGSWSPSTSAPAFYGSGYRYAPVSASETATAEFRLTIPATGRYPVYVWYTSGSNRSRDARFTVHHTGGETPVIVNQQELGNSWIYLGEFQFDAGTSGRVVLSNQGSDPGTYVIADAVRAGGGIGASGQPRWKESAKAFLEHKGFSSAYSDVTSRPRYATWLAGGANGTWRDDFLYFALHTNASGGSGTARGLSTFSYSNGRTPAWGSAGPVTYPTSPSPLTTASDAYRDRVHTEVLSAVRAGLVPAWNDRGTNRMNFGELRESRVMPSTLIELGFHDNAEDAALLKSARFRAVTGRAIYKAIARTWLGANATIIPLPPEALRLETLSGGRVRISWIGVSDPTESSATPSSYRVYLSSDGRGFDNGTPVTGTSTTLSGLTPGQRIYARVAAVNAGGESLPTGVGGAQVGSGSKALIVDGFDREFTHAFDTIEARFTYDYAVEHLQALGGAYPGAPIDYVANEALPALQLSDYALVDWHLGRESSLDRTFDPSEQALVEAYLQGGGALLATGTEIGWDLEARGGGVRFLHDVLGADYVADDAGTRVARTSAGSPFAVLGTLQIDDGSHGSFDAAYPDVLAPLGTGSQTAIAWETGGAPSAVVAQAAPYRVVVAGFPLESVVDPVQREDLAREAIEFLIPGGLSAAPAPTPAPSPSPSPSPTGVAPVTTSSTATPASTAGSGSGGSSGSGGGCSLGSEGNSAPIGGAWLLLLLSLVGLRRRAD